MKVPTLARAARRIVAILLASAAVWLSFLVHPQPLFAYSLRRANVVLYARTPLPPEAAPMLEMDPRRSGLYRRYEVLVAFLLERRGLSVGELLRGPLDRADVERQLEAEPGL